MSAVAYLRQNEDTKVMEHEILLFYCIPSPVHEVSHRFLT
jgi:hypothetical protein